MMQITTVLCAVLLLQSSCIFAVPPPGSRAPIQLEEDGMTTWQSTRRDTEYITLSIPGSGNPQISLRSYDTEDGEWIEDSVTIRNTGCYCKYYGSCTCYTRLSKPLVGYDLLKPSVCGEEEMKSQPFQRQRWGEVTEEVEDYTPCYLLVASSGGRSFAKTIPDNCVPSNEIEDDADLRYNDRGENMQLAPARNPRSVSSITIPQFTKTRPNGKRKFVCRVKFQHYGGPLNLNSNILGHDVKIYYRNNNSEDWGELLTPMWDQYNGGMNRFRSMVTSQHLNQQGVQWWSGCFKCQAEINGEIERSCLGSGCECN